MNIGELAKLSDCSIQTIRYYEKKGLLVNIARSEGNYRVYSEQTKQQLLFIKRCKTLGLTLVEIGQLQQLDHTPQTSCDKINDMIKAHIQEVKAQINELIHLRGQLSALGSRCANNRTIAQCGILEKMKLG